MEDTIMEDVAIPPSPDGAASPTQSRTRINKTKISSTKAMIQQNQSTPVSSSPVQSTSPSPTISARPQFTIPTLPEYPRMETTGGANANHHEFEFTGASSTDDSTSHSQAVLLGIQTLERQQAERERKRQQLERQRNSNIARANPFDTPTNLRGRPQDHAGVPMTVHVTDNSVDEITMGSDWKGLGTTQAVTSVSNKKPGRNRINSISKLLKTPLKPIKRSISDRFNIDPTPTRTRLEHDSPETEPIIFGYLHKLGRNNKWQKRWFESDGKCLKYFKSEDKVKSLAKLDLHRVGSITMDPSDNSDCTFTIEVAGRKYYICADTKEKAMDWVITLNRVKEARMNIGGLKLADPDYDARSGKRTKIRNGSDSDEDEAPARMVLNNARARTKKIGKDDFSDMDKSIEEETADGGAISLMLSNTQSPSAGSKSLGSSSPQHPQFNDLNAFLNPSTLNVLPPAMKDEVVVRWTKQRSALQNWARRISRWAKRMTMVRCVVKDDVAYLSEIQASQQQQQQQQHMNGGNSEDDGKEEPFIDLDVATYSNVPEYYGEEPGTKHVNDLYKSKPTYDFKDRSTENSIQKNSSWKLKNEPALSTGSSIQSSSGRHSPMLAADDDTSGFT